MRDVDKSPEPGGINPSAQVEAAAKAPDAASRDDGLRSRADTPNDISDRRWVVWRYELQPKRQKPTKVPYVAQAGRPKRADVTAPQDLRTLDEALRYAGCFDGLGVVLGNGLCGVDLDHCRDPRTGEIAFWAQEVIDSLDSYSEVSPSGAGVHILCWGCLPAPGGKRNGIELYDSKHYFTFTGEHLPGTPPEVKHRNEALEALHTRKFGRPDRGSQPVTRCPAEPPPYLPDSELLRIAFRSRTGSTIQALWHGDDLHHSTPSEADAALAHHLAFYVRDEKQLEALLRQSGRARAKWGDPRGSATWIAQECAKAVARIPVRYSGLARESPELVRIDRRLLVLPDGPLLFASLRVAGLDDKVELARICGVTVRTVQAWWKQIVDAGLEPVASSRPAKRFFYVARKQLVREDVTIEHRVTGIVLAASADAGLVTIGQKRLAKKRSFCGRTAVRHVAALEEAGLLAVVKRWSWVPDEARRRHCNTYLLLDIAEALHGYAEGREGGVPT